MRKILKKNWIKELRGKRTRAKIFGTSERPRLTVFRSNRYLYAQLIDDNKGHTLAAVSTKELKTRTKNKTESAKLLGEALAEKAKKAGIKKMVFDRGFYKYHGRIKSLEESFSKNIKN